MKTRLLFRYNYRLLAALSALALTYTSAFAQICGNGSIGGPAGTPPSPAPTSGDPINSYTGDESRVIDDLDVWGGAGQHKLQFIRYAHSRTTPGNTWFGTGHNWRHSYQWEMADAGTGNVTINYPDGTAYTFHNYTSNLWRPLNTTGTIPDTLTQSTDDFYLQRPNGDKYHFVRYHTPSQYYVMTDFKDNAGNDYTLTYDAAQRVTQVTEPGGRFLTIAYTSVQVNQANFTTLATVTTAPVQGQYTTLSVSTTQAFRYLRYLSPNGGYTNVSEIQFVANGAPLSGTVFGTGPSYSANSGYTKAFDGSTSSYVDLADSTGGFTGIDLGANNAQAVQSISFYPRTNFSNRMVGGVFQGSNSAPATISVISSVTTSDGRSVAYNYQPYNDPTYPFVYQVLSSVNYPDGTQATYAYTQAYPSTQPLVASFVDPMYASGPMAKSRNDYSKSTANILGAVVNQRGGDTGDIVTTIGAQSIHQPTITYPSRGGKKVFQMWDGNATMSWKTDSLGRQSSFAYDGGGFLNSKTDPRGNKTNYTNTSHNNKTNVTHPDGTARTWTRDSLDLPLTAKDELGNTTTVTRDSQHRPTQVAYADGSSEQMTFNAFGEPLTHKLRNGGTVNAAYDTTGKKTSSTDPLGNVTHYTYDSFDRLASVTDARGNTTAYHYNLRGQVTLKTNPDSSTHSYAYDSFGNKTSETDENGNTTTYTYDQYQRPVTQTDALNRVTRWIYRVNDYTKHPDQVILPSGKITAYTYDSEMQTTSVTVGYGTADAATTRYTYDLAGNKLTQTDPNGHVWTYTYDNRNRKLSQTDPSGNTTSYVYDAADNVTQITRPDGGITTNVYDKMHHVTQTTDPKGEVTTMTYDLAGNLLTRTDANLNTYTYTYDSLNRVTRLTYPDSSTETYAYDGVGNVATYTNRAGAVKTSVFDNRNREVSYTWSDGTPGVTRTFDVAGRLVSSNNGVSSSAYSYDTANQLLSETQTNAVLGAAWPVDYTYDLDGNRSSLVYPSGTSVAYSYTNRNNISAISVGGTNVATYGYDANGNLTSKGLADGTVASYVYDASNRLTTLNHALAGTSFARFDYGYDSVNRRTFEQRDSGTGDVFSYDAVDQVTGVQYDAATPSSNPTGAVRTVGYAYDGTGNRTAVTDTVNGNTAYAVNNLNQYTSVGGIAYSYDGNGNLSGGNGLYIYDAQNRLESAAVGGSVDSFFYDSKNRVVQRTVNGVNAYLIYDGWDLIEERDASGNLTATYVHGVRQDELLSKTDAVNGTVYYHHNALGSVVNLTNASGVVVEKYKYDVFGRPSITDGAGNPITASAYGNHFLFTGREWLAEVSLYDYRNRVYSADLGRFLQTDPLRFSAGDVNIYRYCGNNVNNIKDASGMTPAGTALGAVIGGWAGSIVGAALGTVGGATAGATVGSVVPVIGTALGGVSGGLAGGSSGAAEGAVAGAGIGAYLGNVISNALNESGQTITVTGNGDGTVTVTGTQSADGNTQTQTQTGSGTVNASGSTSTGPTGTTQTQSQSINMFATNANDIDSSFGPYLDAVTYDSGSKCPDL